MSRFTRYGWLVALGACVCGVLPAAAEDSAVRTATTCTTDMAEAEHQFVNRLIGFAAASADRYQRSYNRPLSAEDQRQLTSIETELDEIIKAQNEVDDELNQIVIAIRNSRTAEDAKRGPTSPVKAADPVDEMLLYRFAQRPVRGASEHPESDILSAEAKEKLMARYKALHPQFHELNRVQIDLMGKRRELEGKRGLTDDEEKLRNALVEKAFHSANLVDVFKVFETVPELAVPAQRTAEATHRLLTLYAVCNPSP